MIQDFTGKVAVVTGAASGIGAALAQGFAREGMRVLAADIDLAGVEKTVASIGADALASRVDVASAASVGELADEAFDAFGQVDLLVNNAGVFQGGFCWERSLEDWDWTLGVNVYGIIHGIRSFVPRMIAQGTDGHVVSTASVAAFVGGATSGPYVVSKCAAFALAESLAYDLEAVESRIGSSVLTPSTFDTGIAHTARVRPDRFGTDDKPDAKGVAEMLAQKIATGRPPSDIVEPVLEAIRTNTFLIPTMPSYKAQIRNRFESLLERKLPPYTDVD
jgi:NAD(P)-dependent dehydrogenase (short-subunit alcohol dehydrogenase family)